MLYHSHICYYKKTPIVLNSKIELDYIYNNPVAVMFVAEPEEYLFSSARNYAGIDGSIDVF